CSKGSSAAARALAQPMRADEIATRRVFPLAWPARLRGIAAEALLAPAGEDAGIDVGGPADGRRVAEQGGDAAYDLALGRRERPFAGGLGQAGGDQHPERDQGGAPGAEV